MFGFVMANVQELTPEQKTRYGAIYCGICRQIRLRASNPARLGLRYDMAFLAMLLMSLYEPEETAGPNACLLHPIRKRPWVDNEYIRYAADMNVALSYYKCMDDWQDDKSLSARAMAGVFATALPEIESRYPRQCDAIRRCIVQLRELEQTNCPNADETANCFAQLMAELLIYREDLWAPTLRQLGFSLGRFIYLADAVIDFPADKKRGKYNPFLAMGMGEIQSHWEDWLVLAMGRCTEAFEKLPLVQDKEILDNILYSGVWITLRRKQKEQQAPGGTT